MQYIKSHWLHCTDQAQWSQSRYSIRFLKRLQADWLYSSQHIPPQLQVRRKRARNNCTTTNTRQRVGDIVDVVANGAVQKGLPYKVSSDRYGCGVWTRVLTIRPGLPWQDWRRLQRHQVRRRCDHVQASRQPLHREAHQCSRRGTRASAAIIKLESTNINPARPTLPQQRRVHPQSEGERTEKEGG